MTADRPSAERGGGAPGGDAGDRRGRGERRLGVLGTLVRDTIHGRGPSGDGPVEEWGGICYSLSAFEAAGPEGWTLVPIVKVGRDLRAEALELLGDLDRVGSLEGVRFVDEPNNRVELRYRDRERRTERLRGGVPGWSLEELRPLAAACDALYVNFIAGWELELAAARRLRDVVPGPTYADLHSLFLDVGPGGVREPRRLENGSTWVASFDLVQMNERELRWLAADGGDPWEAARRAVADGPTRAVVVTRGDRGARWAAAPGFRRLGGEGPPEAPASRRRARVGEEPAADVVADADPTGCGDVFGITCFGALLAGAELAEAVRAANRLAARNARSRGGRALAEPEGGGLNVEPGEGT